MKHRRRILKIKPEFQNRIVLEALLVTFTLVNVIVIVAYAMLRPRVNLGELGTLLPLAVAALEALGLALIYYATLKSSHKIAGPVYVIERSLRQVGEGDLTVVAHLRRDDKLLDTRDVFNESVAHLRAEVAEAKRLAAQLCERLPPEAPERELAERLCARMEALKTDTDHVAKEA